MANPEHYDFLTKGFKIWNDWRSISNHSTVPDLSGRHFDSFNFSYYDLSKVNLGGSTFINCIFEEVSFYRSNLEAVNLDDSKLKGLSFSQANLKYANLTNSNLEKANLESADLSKASLTFANLRGANLRNSNLRGADLAGANWGGAYLIGSQVIDAVLDSIEGDPYLAEVDGSRGAKFTDDNKTRKIISRLRDYKKVVWVSESPEKKIELNNPELIIKVIPGTASPEEISDVMAEISILYRMIGGSGISFSPSSIQSFEEVGYVS